MFQTIYEFIDSVYLRLIDEYLAQFIDPPKNITPALADTVGGTIPK